MFAQDGHPIPLEVHGQKLQYKRRLYQDFAASKWQASRHAKAFEALETLTEKVSRAKKRAGDPQKNEEIRRFVPEK